MWVTLGSIGASILGRGLQSPQVKKVTVIHQVVKKPPVWPWYLAAGLIATAMMQEPTKRKRK
jgi:hypothetical protein